MYFHQSCTLSALVHTRFDDVNNHIAIIYLLLKKLKKLYFFSIHTGIMVGFITLSKQNTKLYYSFLSEAISRL